MTVGFLNALMLLGLAALVIPPLIHLLNRRRYDVVPWGAMQFLQVSESTRRRLLIEQLLLMALRMGLIALLVLALAAPYGAGRALQALGGRENRDVILVFDGSTSMGFEDGDRSPHRDAQQWAETFLADLAPGDAVAVLQAKQQAIPALPRLTEDLNTVREAVRRLAPPCGSCDLPQAVQTAHDILRASHRPRREVIVLTDGQRYGWADPAAEHRWQLLARRMDESTGVRPRVWVVVLGGERPAKPANWSLGRLRTGRALASTHLTFDTELGVQSQDYAPPHRLRLEISPTSRRPTPAGSAAASCRSASPAPWRRARTSSRSSSSRTTPPATGLPTTASEIGFRETTDRTWR
jgi:hypothetical protein